MSKTFKPHAWREPFLAALSEVPVILYACRAANVERSTVWRVRKADDEFNAAVEEAMEAGIDKAEQEAFRRSVSGYEEPVIDKGRLAYRYERYTDGEGKEHYRPLLDDNGQPVPLTVRKHSDALMSLILKGRRKKVYADRTELTGADGGPMQMDEATRSARVAQLLALAAQRKEAEDEFGDLA